MGNEVFLAIAEKFKWRERRKTNNGSDISETETHFCSIVQATQTRKDLI